MAILLETRSDSTQAQADLVKLRGTVESIQSSVEKTTNSFVTFSKTIAAGFAGFTFVSGILRLSDGLTNLETKLTLATESQEEFNRALKDVRSIAISTRSDLESVGTLYSKISRSSKSLGANQAQVAKVTDLITKSISAAGATTQETNSAILQLGQGLASGTLAGEELRAILENAPPLAEAIAKGLGKSVGELKKLGEAGQLTSFSVFKAILSQQKEIEKNFSKIKITYGAAFLNLKQSLVILFDEVKKASLGSTDSFAVSINNIAKSIFSFATNLKLNLLKARVFLSGFVLDAIFLFYDLNTVIEEISLKVLDLSNEFYKSWVSNLDKVVVKFKEWSIVAVAFSKKVITSIYEYISKSNFGAIVIESLKTTFTNAFEIVKSAFNSFVNNFIRIDINKFIPNLDKALATVKNWVIAVEGWFFWLYDKVIGNSWIPDLVLDTIKWLGKLSQKPLNIVQDFVKKLNLNFSSIRIVSVLGAGLTMLNRYKGALLGILGVITAIGAGFAGLTLLAKSGKINLETPGTKIEEYTKKSLDWLKKIYAEGKNSFNTSVFGRTMKQVLGMPDRTPGQIFGVNIDTRPESKVGRGPFRMEDFRFPGHDVINAFPPGWQVPLIVAFTGIFAIAIMKAFEAGTTRSVLLSVLTTAAGIFAAKTVDPAAINKSFGSAAFKILDILEKGITALFSGNVLKDPFGVLSIIAKTSLLFEEGRRAAGRVALGIGTAPTRAAITVSDIFQRRALNREATLSTETANRLPQQLNAAFQANQRALDGTVARLSRMRDDLGYVIGRNRASAAIAAGNVDAFGTDRARRAVQEGIVARRDLEIAQRDLAGLGARQTELRAISAEATRRSEAITQRLREQADAFRAGVQNVGAGAGGILGGLAGYQIGTELARGMTNSPEWVKVGVAISTSFAGQAIGASIGLAAAQLITNAVVNTATLVGNAISGGLRLASRLLTNPFVIAGLLIATAIATVLNWDTLKIIFTAFSDFWTNTVMPFLTKLGKKLEEIVDKIREETGAKLDKPVAQVAGTEITGRDVANVGVFSTYSAILLAGLAKFTTIFDGTMTSFRNFFSNAGVFIERLWYDVLARYYVAMYRLQSNFPAFAQLQRLIGASFAYIAAGFSSIRAYLPNWIAVIVAGIGTAFAVAFSASALTTALVVALAAALAYGVWKLATKSVDFMAPSKEALQIPGAAPAPPPINKASGGWIRGPGSGTSDSIPAMLSNGEFVVNAKDASKNWDILTAINSGIRVNHFADGTEAVFNPKTILSKTSEKMFKKKKSAETAEEAKIDTVIKTIKNDLFTFLADSYLLPKEPLLRPFVAGYTFESLKQGKILNLREAILSSAGLTNEDYEKLSPYQKKRVNEVMDEGGSSALAELGMNTIAQDIIKNIFGGIVAFTGVLPFAIAKSIAGITMLADQTILPGVFGALRGLRNFRGGSVLGNNKADLLLKQLEETPYIGKTSLIIKPVRDLITEVLAGIQPPSERDRRELQGYLSDLYARTGSLIDLEKLDPDTLLPRNYSIPLDTVQKKASGGWIRGPGSGTSDSIPAMLSNGEFVVNAADASKNWDILTAINNGDMVRRFNQGGGADRELRYPPGPIPKGYQKVKDPIEAVLDKFVSNFKVVSDKFEDIADRLKLNELFGKGNKADGPTAIEEKAFTEQIDAAENIKEAASILERTLTSSSFGFKNIDIKGLETQSPEVLRSIASIAETIRKDAARAEKLPKDSIGRKIAQDIIDTNRNKLAELLESYKIPFEKPGNLKPGKAVGKSDILVGDFVKIINDAFPKLNLSAEELDSLSDNALQTLISNAVKVKKAFSNLDTKVVGTIETGLDVSAIPKRLQQQRADLKSEADSLQNIALDIVAPLRSGFRIVENEYKDIGVNITREAFNSLTEAERNTVADLRKSAERALLDAKLPDSKITNEKRAEAERYYAELIKQINDIFNKAGSRVLGNYSVIKTLLADFNVNFEESVYNLLTDIERKTVLSYIEALKANKVVPGMSEEDRIKAQNVTNNLVKALQKGLQLKSNTDISDAEKAAQSFASSITESLTSTISDVFKGKKSIKEGLKGILDTFTSSVIDTFVKSLLNPFTKQDGGILNSMFKSLSLGVSNTATGLLPSSAIATQPTIPPVQSVLGQTPTNSINDNSKSLLDTLKNGFASFLNLLGPIGAWFANLIGINVSQQVNETTQIGLLTSMDISLKMMAAQAATSQVTDMPALASFLGLASGGKVSGPGTGTSDSIAAMLSNGEYVINAEATKQHLNLLNAINSGDLRKFADGGLVSTAIMAPPIISNTTPEPSNKSSQIINVHITGDISRQTRSQIYEMLPSIAEGVNMHNREKGYKR